MTELTEVQSTPARDGTRMFPELLTQVEGSILRLTEVWASGRWWTSRVVVGTLLILFFLSCPSYEAYEGNRGVGTWKAVMMKADNLTYNLLNDFGPTSNASRVNFRLLMPALARVTGMGPAGLLVVQGIAGVLLLFLVAALAYRETSSRTVAALVTLMTGSTFAGTTSFVEHRGVFDGVSICLMLGCMYFSNPALIALFLFAAGWNDERALLAAPLIVVYRLVQGRDGRAFHFASFFSSPLIGLYLGGALHLVSRWYYLTQYAIPHRFDGNGIRVLLNQINMIPMGLWTAFEGGWLLLPLALLILYRQRQYVVAILFVLALSGLLLVSLSVVDVSRTTAYCLPAVFVCLALLSRTESPDTVWRLCCVACLISLLWPAYYVGGKSSIWWQYPLPLQILRWTLLKE